MSTYKEKIDAIKYGVASAKRRLDRLEALKSIKAITKAQEYELEMTLECIRRGEKILKEANEL